MLPFGPGRVTVDRARGVVLVQDGRRSQEYALHDVVGLQVCSNGDPAQRGLLTHIAYGLNLVLADPPGKRVLLACHGHRDALFSDGRRLAEFLGVPLWDHTTVE